jgi:hypothetical protein
VSIETEGFATDTSPRTAGRLVRSYRVLWSVLLLGWLVSSTDRTLTGPVISWMIQNKAGFIGEAAHPATLGRPGGVDVLRLLHAHPVSGGSAR